MAKPTLKELKRMVDELLTIQTVAERYGQLKNDIKKAMEQLDHWEVVIDGKGRVEATPSERTIIEPDMARTVLGDVAERVIQVKESVPNKLVEALVTTKVISQEKYTRLLEQAKKTESINLRIRPLK